MFTITRALKWWVWEHPQRLALDYDGEEITYAELYAWSSRIARSLMERGINPGDRVSTFGANSLEYAALIIGIMLARGSTAPISFRSTTRELKRTLDVLTPTLLFADEERWHVAREALGGSASIQLHSLSEMRPPPA